MLELLCIGGVRFGDAVDLVQQGSTIFLERIGFQYSSSGLHPWEIRMRSSS